MPFNRNRYHATVNWNWHYGTGDIGNDGVHWLDVARWVMNVGLPLEVSGMGRKLAFDDDQQTPDTQNIEFNYDDKLITFEQRLWNPYLLEGTDNAVFVYGTEGTVQTGRFLIVCARELSLTPILALGTSPPFFAISGTLSQGQGVT